MNIKNLSILTGALAVLAIITFFIKNADSSLPTDPRVGESAVAPESLRDVATIELQSGGETITLNFNPESSQWLLEESHSLPVDMDTLSRITTRLTEARVERLVSAKAERIAELGFGDESIRFESVDGATVAQIELGRTTDSGKQLIKYGDEEKAFLLNDQISIQSDPLSWLDKQLLEIERSDIRSASFDLGEGGTLSFERASSTDQWTTSDELPDGKQLDQAAIDRAVNRFASVRFTDLHPLDSDEVQDARENSHRIEIALEDGTSYAFEIGRRPEVKTEKEVETEDENGETTTETEEVVETPAGPVILSIHSSKADAPFNEYMERTAFEVSSQLYTNLPRTTGGFLQEKPEPEPEAEPEPNAETATPESNE